MSKLRIANSGCGAQVGRRMPFTANNIFAVVVAGDESEGQFTDRYIVYSYGEHFPMYIWEGMRDGSMGTWYRNTDKWGVTTSKHQSQAYPHGVQPDSMVPMDTRRMICITMHGTVGLAVGAATPAYVRVTA